MEIQFTALFQRVPEGFIAFVEELPGANAQGTTLDEARANIVEAVKLVLDANREPIEQDVHGRDVIRESLKVGARSGATWSGTSRGTNADWSAKAAATASTRGTRAPGTSADRVMVLTGGAGARTAPGPRERHRPRPRPLGAAETEGVWLRSWRLMSPDGTCLDVAETPANEAAFSRPGSARGERRSAFPQVRLVGLCGAGTHAIVDAAFDPYGSVKRDLAGTLLRSPSPVMPCIADRGFYSDHFWRAAAATGAELLWRVKTSSTVRREGPARRLLPGQHRRRQASACRPRAARAGDRRPPRWWGRARLPPPDHHQRPDAASAAERTGVCTRRWELESAFAELKMHQRGPSVVLRSKQRDGVLQEAYAYLCTHYANRTLMHEAALSPNSIPTECPSPAPGGSPAAQPGRTRAFPPETEASAYSHALEEIRRKLLPPRRHRNNARVIKRKMSNYGVKPREHSHRPHSTEPRTIIIPATK